MTMCDSTTRIRPESAGDEATIYEVNRLAFGRGPSRGWSTPCALQRLSSPSSRWWPSRPAGCRAHPLQPRHDSHDGWRDPVLVLGPVAVLPECQNRGLGSQLIVAGLEDARTMGERIVVLVGHPWYYPRFGFKPARPLGMTTRPPSGTRSSWRWSSPPARWTASAAPSPCHPPSTRCERTAVLRTHPSILRRGAGPFAILPYQPPSVWGDSVRATHASPTTNSRQHPVGHVGT